MRSATGTNELIIETPCGNYRFSTHAYNRFCGRKGLSRQAVAAAIVWGKKDRTGERTIHHLGNRELRNNKLPINWKDTCVITHRKRIITVMVADKKSIRKSRSYRAA